MAHAHEADFDSAAHNIDYREQLAVLLGEFPQAALTSTTQDFVFAGLTEMDARYGRRPYHDGQHPLGVLRRGFEWLEEFARYTDTAPSPEDYEVLAVASAYHDIILVNTSDDPEERKKSPERLSAEHTQALLFYLDYAPEQADRIFNAILATEVEYTGQDVLQTMATKTKPDIATAALLMADIGNVLYRDDMVMVQDMTDVAAEELYKIDEGITTLKEDQTPLGKVMAIVDKQRVFRDQRFSDLPKILNHHLGNSAMVSFMKDHLEPLTIQRAITDDLIDRINTSRAHIEEEFLPTVTNKEATAKQKADAFFKAVCTILNIQSP